MKRRVQRSSPSSGSRAGFGAALLAVLVGSFSPAALGTRPLSVAEQQPPEAYLAWLHAVRTGAEEPGDAGLDDMLRDGPGRRLLTRIAAVEHLRQHPHPELGPALMETFARARFGELPEDPDLFERALRALQALPTDAQRRALVDGLGPVLARVAFADLSRRWLAPALHDHPPSVQEAILEWPRHAPDAWAVLEQGTAADLEEAWERHGPALLPAMSVEGGSIAHLASRRVDDAVMGALLQSAPETATRALIGVAVQRAADGPAVHAALQVLASTGRAEAAAARSALDTLPGAPLPDVAPPAIPPGRVPGLELQRPTPERLESLHVPGSGPHGARPGALVPALVGLAVLVGAGVLGARSPLRRVRALAGLGVAAGVLLLVESGARTLDVPLLADTQPLFSYVPSGATTLSSPPTGEPGWVQTVGGSIRATLVPEAPPPGRTRVAFLGASSVHGSHALAEETFAAVSVAAANASIGHDALEALNLGVGGATSAIVRQAGEAALAVGARILVVYYGHNEVDQFIRLGRHAGADAARLRLRDRLHRTALYSLLHRLLPPPPPTAVVPPDSSSLERADIEALRSVATEHHRWNLQALLRAAERQGAEVILARTAVNHRFAHLEAHAEPGPGDAEDLAARRALGEARARAGDGVEARAAFQSAIDVSAWPREATSSIDAATVGLAQDHGCALFDTPALLAAHAPDGVTASGAFWDDLHPTPEGHRIIGEALAPLLVAARERLE